MRKLSLYERQHASRWTSRVDRWNAFAWASSHRDLSSSTSRFCYGEHRDRRSAIMANPWQIHGNQGSSTSHLRIGEQPIDSLSHHTRDLLRRLHQTDHATIARDALRARVLQHQFPEQLTCGEGRVRRGEHLHAATSIPGEAHRRRRPAPATPTRRQVSPAVAVLVRGDGPSRSDQQVPT